MRSSVHRVVTVAALFMTGLVVPVYGGSDAEVWTYGGAFDLAIPADPDATRGWMDEAIIEVPDHLLIQDVDVSLSVTHTNIFDLQLFVTSPAGTTVLLNSYDPLGGFFEGADYQGTVFDDEAETSIVDGDAPFAGRFRPLASEGLAAFDGEDAFGLWQLDIYDAHYLDTGSLNAFGLTVTTPEPATGLILLAGLAIVGLSARRRCRRGGRV